MRTRSRERPAARRADPTVEMRSRSNAQPAPEASMASYVDESWPVALPPVKAMGAIDRSSEGEARRGEARRGEARRGEARTGRKAKRGDEEEGRLVGHRFDCVEERCHERPLDGAEIAEKCGDEVVCGDQGEQPV